MAGGPRRDERPLDRILSGRSSHSACVRPDQRVTSTGQRRLTSPDRVLETVENKYTKTRTASAAEASMEISVPHSLQVSVPRRLMLKVRLQAQLVIIRRAKANGGVRQL